jgi:hypothetical protein
VPENIVTAIVFPVSLIVPTTPFRENAVIAFADDDAGAEVPPSLMPYVIF